MILLFSKHHLWKAEDIRKNFSPLSDLGKFELVNVSLLLECTGSLFPYVSFINNKCRRVDICCHIYGNFKGNNGENNFHLTTQEPSLL